jgi:competence protein ComEA
MPEQAAPVGVQAPETRGGTNPTRLQLSTSGPLNLNTADTETLQALPGIGPTLAEQIVAYRQEHGPFQTVEELLQVPGIGPKRWERIRHVIRVTVEEP